MSFRSLNSCTNISVMLDSQTCSLVDLLKESNIQTALKKRIPNLAEYLADNAGQLVDIALGTEKTNTNIQFMCFSIIVTQVKSLTSLLLSSDSFLQHLNDFISNNKDIDENGATGFARIFKFIINQTNGEILNRWPERTELFQKIINHMGHIAIHYLLDDITSDARKTVVTFLEDCNATTVLLSNVSNDFRKTKKLYLYLTNLISIIEIDSPLLSLFENTDKMNEIFDLALSTNNAQLSSQIFIFLDRLAEQIDYDTDEESSNQELENQDPLVDSVIQLGKNRINQICEFLNNDSPFLGNKENAMRLLRTLLLHSDSISENVFEYGEKLFNLLFENPAHSILHASFLSFFDTLSTDPEKCLKFIKSSNIKNRIIEAFEKRDQTNASYWGILFDLCIKIEELSPSKDEDDWQKFKESVIDKTQSIINNGYGGKLPAESDASDFEDLVFPLGRSQMQGSE